MSFRSARSLHERLVTNEEFRTACLSGSEAVDSVLRASGYSVDPREWDELLTELEDERRAAGAILALANDGQTEEALSQAHTALARFPLSWQTLDLYSAMLARAGKRQEIGFLAAGLSPDHPRFAYLDLAQKSRALDMVFATLAFALWSPIRDAPPPGPDPTVYDGGWQMLADLNYWPLRQDVRSADRPSSDHFLREFAQRNEPVVLRGLIDDWPASTRWRRDALLRTHGETKVNVLPSDTVVDSLRNGAKRQNMTLAAFVDRMSAPDRPYLFYGLDFSAIAEDILEPDILGPAHFSNDAALRAKRSFFFLGGAGTGVGFHQHVAAWNALIYGYKRWFLIPPHSIHKYRDTPIATLAAQRPLPEDVFEFLQEPGELVFVPQYWHHATFNLTDCIGIAREIGTINEGWRHLKHRSWA